MLCAVLALLLAALVASDEADYAESYTREGEEESYEGDVLLQHEQSIVFTNLAEVEDAAAADAATAGQRPLRTGKGLSLIQAKHRLGKAVFPNEANDHTFQVAPFMCSLVLVASLLGSRRFFHRLPSTDGEKATRILAQQPAETQRWLTAVRAGDVAACWQMSEGKQRLLTLRDDFGCTALHVAAAEGSLEILRLLLELGASVRALDSMTETPLHMAARREGGEAWCEALLASGAEVNAANCLEQTPLMVAAEAQRFETCQRLLAAGASTSGVADAALPLALTAAVAACVVTSAADQGEAFDRCAAALREQDPEGAEAELGAQPRLLRRRDAWGCSLLHIAASAGNHAAVAALLSRGAFVDAADAWGEAPLHMAARAEGGLAACLALLAARADVNAEDLDGVTPLVVAAGAGHEATCNALLERGGSTKGLADRELPPLLTSLLVERVFEGNVAVH